MEDKDSKMEKDLVDDALVVLRNIIRVKLHSASDARHLGNGVGCLSGKGVGEEMEGGREVGHWFVEETEGVGIEAEWVIELGHWVGEGGRTTKEGKVLRLATQAQFFCSGPTVQAKLVS